jgi:crossover junction endodeoxyribonuclease RuvC
LKKEGGKRWHAFYALLFSKVQGQYGRDGNPQLEIDLVYTVVFMEEKIILGIDPGSLVMGFGVIQVSKKNGTKVLAYDVCRFKSNKKPMVRMYNLYACTLKLLQEHTPDEVAIETVFYGKNIQSMLTLGRAQGIAIAAALACGIPVSEYAPCKVKQAVTGKGTASKESVARIVGQLLGISLSTHLLDASDALAVALCHSQQKQPMDSKKNTTTWTQFVEKNPQRMV